MKTMHTRRYKVLEKIRETADAVTLRLGTTDGSPLSYVPGQFITVFFPESGTPEGKSYSLSSAPHENDFSITVKAMGEFSNKLAALEPGDFISASDPYGFFYSESPESDMVILAAGIGIAPFRSMIKNARAKGEKRTILLHYSIRSRADIIFHAELDKWRSEFPNFSLSYHFTRDGKGTRMSPGLIVESLPPLASPEFFLCGSISFVRDMWKGLREAGVPEEIIYTEAFFSH